MRLTANVRWGDIGGGWPEISLYKFAHGRSMDLPIALPVARSAEVVFSTKRASTFTDTSRDTVDRMSAANRGR